MKVITFVVLLGMLSSCALVEAVPFNPILDHSDIRKSLTDKEADAGKIVKPEQAEGAQITSGTRRIIGLAGIVILMTVSIVCITKQRARDKRAL